MSVRDHPVDSSHRVCTKIHRRIDGGGLYNVAFRKRPCSWSHRLKLDLKHTFFKSFIDWRRVRTCPRFILLPLPVSENSPHFLSSYLDRKWRQVSPVGTQIETGVCKRNAPKAHIQFHSEKSNAFQPAGSPFIRGLVLSNSNDRTDKIGRILEGNSSNCSLLS